MLENFNIEGFNFYALFPMFILIFGAICIMAANAFTLKFSRSLNVALCMLFLALDLSFSIAMNKLDGSFGMIGLDGLATLTQIIILIATFFFIFLAISKQRYAEFQTPEFYPLYLFMTAGFQFMVSSDNLILILLGIETASLALCVLIAFNDENTGIEAAIKYFIMGVLASAFYIIGAMMIYLATGGINISDIASAIVYQGNIGPNLLIISGLVFIIGAIGFKISLVPFHTWMPDVYEGSNPVLAGYISIVPKIAGFALAIRILSIFLNAQIQWVENLLYILVVLTITVPNIMAFMQEDVKRMLSFSSISHSGFALACVLINTNQSLNAMYLYWFLFLITNIGSFSILWLSKNKKRIWHDRYDHPYTKFQGLVRIYPLMAILLAIFMFSLAGIPPFAVFWGKMLAVSSALNAGYIYLAVIMMLNSAIAAYYYLKLIVFMFLREPIIKKEDSKLYIENATYSIKGVIGIAAIACCLSIFMVQFLLEIGSKYLINNFY